MYDDDNDLKDADYIDEDEDEDKMEIDAGKLFGWVIDLFEGILENKETNRVERYENEQENLVVSTILAYDTKRHETAIKHPRYNDGKYIIVEVYENEDSAKKGHDAWVKRMTTEPLPEMLLDRQDMYLTDVFDAGVGKQWRMNPIDEEKRKDEKDEDEDD